ncbi:acyltransferase family protein [Flagellimonas marinaquae]|uniref:acyltransferase family protein n=1 Tax=Flagellimonas marinaquae TaxID=254955 RepID=UPI003B58975F
MHKGTIFGLPSKIDNIDFLRVFGISIVVLRHAFAPFTGSWDVGKLYGFNEVASIIGSYISTISMPLFVFISGFLFSYLRNYLNKYQTYPILIKKKTRRLLIPYLVLSPLYIYSFLDYISFFDFIKYIWSGPGHLWFLPMIFILFLIFYPLESFLKTNIIRGSFLLLFLFSLGPITHYIGLPALAKVFKYIPFFYLGYMFYLKNDVISKYLRNKFYLFFFLHLALFFFFYAILPNYVDNRILSSLIAHFKLIPLGLLSITFVYILFSTTNGTVPKSLENIIGTINKNSYYIYLIHEPLLKIFYEIDIVRSLPIYLVIIAGFTISFFTSLILSEVILKFKVGRLLIGA